MLGFCNLIVRHISRTAHVLFAKNLIALRSGRDVTKCRLEAAVLKLVSREGTFAIGFVIWTVSNVLDKKSSLLCHNMYLMYCNPIKS